MAAALQIPLPAPLKTTNLAIDWECFKGQWTNYIRAAKLDRGASNCRATIFHACLVSDTYEILAAMEFTQEEDKEDPVKLLNTFKSQFVSKWSLWVICAIPSTTRASWYSQFVAWRFVTTCQNLQLWNGRRVGNPRPDCSQHAWWHYAKKLFQMLKLTVTQAVDICHSLEVTLQQLKSIIAPDEVQDMMQQQQWLWPITYTQWQLQNLYGPEIH